MMADETPATHSVDRLTVTDEQLCVATLDDQQAVMDIDQDLYHGMDYLPVAYPQLVTGPGVRGFLCKLGGRVVGFVSTRLVDGGQTLVTSAGRVAADCQGVGLYGRFKRRVLQDFCQSRDIRYIAMTVDNTNMAARGTSILKTYRTTSEKVLTIVEMNVAAANKSGTWQTTQDSHTLKQLSREDVHHILSRDPADLEHIFPGGRFVLGWKPYRVMAANAGLIAAGGTRVFIASSQDNGPETPEGSFFPVTVLSSGDYYTCKKGLNYQIEVYGSGSEDELRAHVIWHLRRAMLTTGNTNVKTVIFMIFYARKLHDVLEEVREMFCIKPSDLPYEKVYSLEADFAGRVAAV